MFTKFYAYKLRNYYRKSQANFVINPITIAFYNFRSLLSAYRVPYNLDIVISRHLIFFLFLLHFARIYEILSHVEQALIRSDNAHICGMTDCSIMFIIVLQNLPNPFKHKKGKFLKKKKPFIISVLHFLQILAFKYNCLNDFPRQTKSSNVI